MLGGWREREVELGGVGRSQRKGGKEFGGCLESV